MVDFRIQVTIDPRRAVQGTRRVNQAIERTTRSAGRLQQALRSAFAPLLGIAGAGLVVRTLANFEQEIAAVGAISQASAQELAQFRDVAIDLGTNTRFSATQAAEGLTFLARAGFTAAESLEAIEGTLQLAQAGQLSLGRAADIASNVLQGFRLDVAETARVVDVLALSANSSNTNIEQLGTALSFAAPIAAGLGVTLEETTAAISALSNAGLQGSRAGTGLNRVLANLEAPTDAAKEILADLGVEAAEVQVTTVGLTAALERLSNAGVSTGQALQIFGQRGGPAFEVLSSSVRDVESFTGQFERATGTVVELADALDDNLLGSLLALRSAFQGIILQAGEAGLTNALRGVVDVTTEGFRAVADNIEIARAGFVVFSTVLTAQFVPAITASTSGVVAQTLALVGFNTASSVSIVSARRFAIALRAIPFAAIAASIVSINDSLGDYVDLQEELLDIQEAGVGFALTDFARANQALTQAQRQLAVTQAEVTREQEAGREATGALASIYERQKARVEELTEVVNAFKEANASSTEEVEEFQNAITKQAASVDALIASLERENEILLLNQREREIQFRLAEEIARIEEESGQTITDAQERALESSIRRNTSFQEQSALLDDIRGKTREFGAQAAALNELRRNGLITEEQFTTQLAALREEYLGVADATRQVSAAQEENSAAAERSARAYAALGAGLATLAAGSIAEQIQSISRGLNAAQGPVAFFEQTARDLNAALEAGVISQEEFTIATNNLRIASAQAGNDLGGGLEVGLARVQNQILNTSGLVEDALVGAFNNAEDALVDFLTTGEADFSRFVDSLLEDITRLLIRQALIGALGFGGIPGFADGGQVPANRPILVGEEGPELFIPPSSGRIASNPETRDLLSAGSGGGSPSINVTNVVVSDPSEVTAALNSPEGEQTILNVIRRNASTVRQSIS